MRLTLRSGSTPARRNAMEFVKQYALAAVIVIATLVLTTWFFGG
ncbi:MAG: hypothetical protein BIFFINMI_00222 [Phycisphaerae bacterium]|nr:hypothetical protein [Phycisphaerae bacterium]